MVRVLDTAAELKAGTDGRVSFDEFLGLLEQAGPAGPLEGPDPKVHHKEEITPHRETAAA